MKNKEIKYLLILTVATLIILGCYFLPYVMNNIPLTYGTDLKPQWFEFYTEFERLIKEFFQTGTLPFYSWTLFLGNNFFASKSYYLMGDLFSYIGLLFNTEFFKTAMYLEVIKLFVAAYSMYFFLKKVNIKPYTRIIGSLCYAFSAWAIFFSGQLSFLSFYCLMPLYFLGIELFFKDRKFVLFILMTMILVLTNFYFFYTVSIFTVLYFSYRYYIIHHNFKYFWKNAFILIGYYLIGILCSAVLTIPTLFYILGNDRIGDIKYFFAFDQLRIYLHNLVAAFVPNYLYIYQNNIFETGWHVTRELCMWSGTLIAVISLQIIGYKEKIFKKATILVYSILFVILIVPIFNSVVHGFGDPSLRWTLFFIFFNIFIACNLFDNRELWDKKYLTYSTIIMFVLVLCIIPIIGLTDKLSLLDVFQNYSHQLILFGSFALLIIIYGVILKIKPKYLESILIALIMVEMIVSGSMLYNKKIGENSSDTYEFINNVTHVLQSTNNELNNFLNSIEPINTSQYFRVYVPHQEIYWDYSHNMSLIYNLNGLMTYDSTYAPSFNKMKMLVPQVKDFESEWIFNIKDAELLKFLNTKYALVLKEDELPKGLNWRLITPDYRGFIQVYRNDDYRELGTSYSYHMSFEDFEKLKNPTQLFNTTVISDNQELSNMVGNDSAVLENIQYGKNQLTAYSFSEDDTFMVLTIPYDKGWKVLNNGIQIKTYDVNGGFIGIQLTEGDNNIEMYFIPSGFKLGVILSGLGFLLFIILIVMHKRKVNVKEFLN
ncbi:MAG: YfhO family protein [Anaerorhabdus sp.]|uniref:YfhO family protein n=1 Tax=Anaerorhabdus sp. TaxID=1872524 RepID=UPI002FC6E4E6